MIVFRKRKFYKTTLNTRESLDEKILKKKGVERRKKPVQTIRPRLSSPTVGAR